MKEVDVLIVGSGITGAALFMMLSRYTNMRSVALIDRNAGAEGSSGDRHNSQTLHAGDIEVGYSEHKAWEARRAVNMLANYSEKIAQTWNPLFRYPKLMLGVGDSQCAQLALHIRKVGHLYPKMRLVTSREEIAAIEPLAIKGRDLSEVVHALVVEDVYSAASFEGLTYSFTSSHNKRPGFTQYKAEVLSIIPKEHGSTSAGFIVKTSEDVFVCKQLVIAAGAEGLLLAQQIPNVADHLPCIGIHGSFWYARDLRLKTKLYMLPSIAHPFAPIHADRDVVFDAARFGPTAKVILSLRHGIWLKGNQYFRMRGRRAVFKWLKGLLSIPATRNYLIENWLYELPFIGKRLLVKEARKLVPSVTANQLSKANGGMRAQVLNTRKGAPELGGVEIDVPGLLVRVTISPGATACLLNAEHDLIKIANFLGVSFNAGLIDAELHTPHNG